MAGTPSSGDPSALPMTDEEFRQLFGALLNAFRTKDELEQVVAFTFSRVDLADITDGNLRTAITDLIKWADARDAILPLIEGARGVNDGNQELRQVESYWRTRPTSPAVVPPAARATAITSSVAPSVDPQSANGFRLPIWSYLVAMSLLVALVAWILQLRVLSTGPVFVTPTDPTTARQVTEIPEENAGLLAYAANTGESWDLFVYDFANRASTAMTRSPTIAETAPAWSHAGDRLAYVAEAAGSSPQVRMMGRDQSDPHAVTAFTGGNRIWYVAWSADDEDLIITIGDGAQAWLVTVPSSAREVDEFVEFVPPPASRPSVASTGEMVYVTVGGPNLDLVLADETGAAIRVLTDSDAVEDMPSLSPNGRRVAFNVGPSDSRRVALLSTEGGEQTELRRIGRDDSNPVWSPDGESLALVANDQDVWVVPLGDGAPAKLDLASGLAMSEVWYLSWTR